MPSYEIYPLDETGRICGLMRITQATDAMALDVAQLLLESGQSGEVWQRDRFVGRVGNIKRDRVMNHPAPGSSLGQ